MSLKLFLDYCSQPCRAIVIFARMNNINLECKTVSFVTGETSSEWFRKITPMHAVPVLDDEGFVLTESVAILSYLSKKFKVAGNWYPEDIRQGARVDEFVTWLYCPRGLRMNGARVFIEQGLIPHRTQKPVNQEALAQRIDVVKPILGTIESYFLSRGDFIAGTDDITIADLLAICEMMQPMSVGYDVTEGNPKLAKWFDRVKARLQPHFDDVHKEILEFGANYKLVNDRI